MSIIIYGKILESQTQVYVLREKGKKSNRKSIAGSRKIFFTTSVA
jgi:preprotein translocase subunit Sec63